MRAHDQGFDIVRRALDHCFHAAVATVAHPPGDVKLSCFEFDVIAETYTLHAAGDYQMLCNDEHGCAMARDALR